MKTLYGFMVLVSATLISCQQPFDVVEEQKHEEARVLGSSSKSEQISINNEEGSSDLSGQVGLSSKSKQLISINNN
jgi:hypothetical protein